MNNQEPKEFKMNDQKSLIIAVGVLTAASVYWFLKKRISNVDNSNSKESMKSPLNQGLCHIHQSILNRNPN